MSAESQLRQRVRYSESPTNDDLSRDKSSSRQEKQCNTASCRFRCCLKTLLSAFCIIYVAVPLIFYSCLWLRQHIIFLTFINIPPFLNLSDPHSFALHCPQQLYLDSDPGIRLGAWYVQSQGLEECSKDLFPGSNPVVLYLHGNSGSRGGTHRVGLYKLLSSKDINAHVLAFDYRGYGDSTSHRPTVGGVVSDAVAVYNWIRKEHNVPAKRIIIWGHSLGTGVAVYLMARLNELGEHPAGFVLESPFDQLHNVLKYHPLSKLHRLMPGFQQIFVDTIRDEPTTNFDSLSRVDKISAKVPLMILHAEDDAVVPFDLGRNLHKKFEETRTGVAGSVPAKFVAFSADYNYGHKYIFQHPDLPQMIKQFFERGL